MNTFTFTGKAKTTLLIIMLAGLALIGLGALTFGGGSHGHDDGHGDSHGQEEQVDAHAVELQHEDGTHDVTVDDAHAATTEEHHEDMHAEETHATEDAGHHAAGHETDAHAEGHDSHGGEHHGVVGATPVTAGKVLWTNLWVIVQMLFWMAMAAMFFLAAHTVGWAGFHIMFQKVTLGIMSILPVAIVLGIIVFIFGHHDIFIWTNPAAMEASELMASKSDFLNFKTFGIMSIAWSLIVVFLLSRWWAKLKAQDEDPDLKHFRTARTLGAITIVLVAVINAFGVWHWLMSIEPNWYSTMYAWYTMASGAAIMFAVTILVLLYLQSQGYLPNLNDSHYHDIGKYLFAISVFWTYVWFSQYMLIWYGNIPEETVYFKERLGNYPIIWYGALIINFFLAFFVLLKRDAKRNKGVLIFACVMIIIGHWFDFFIMVVPYGVAKGGMGLMSVGALLLFVGITGFVILSALSRVKSLDSREHPYYHESLKHHI
ncbi:MAG: hypothetical protein R2730_11245 [Chitinophagales bacterium]